MTPSGVAGDQLAVTAQPNTGSARSAVVTVTSGSATSRVTVSQAALTLSVSPTSWTSSPTGASQAVQVQASAGTWQIDPASVPAWLTVERRSGSNSEWFVLRTDRNLGSTRSATVTITSATISRTVSVTQTAAPTATVTTSISSWTAPAGSGAQVVTVTTNGNPWQATANQSWVKLGATSGTTGALLVVGVDPNNSTTSRTATVTLTAGTATRTVTVTQPGGGGGAAYTPLASLTPTGGNAQFDTGLTGQVTVTDDASWLTSSVAGGVVTVSATANTGQVRLAVVTTRVSGVVTSTHVIVQQGVASVTGAATTWAPSASGASVSRTVTATQGDTTGAAHVTATSDAIWLHVPTGPQNSGTVMQFAADPNTSGATRTATITLTTEAGARTTTTVTQSSR